MSMSRFDSGPLASAALDVLTLIPEGREALATIAGHEECDNRLRKRTFEFDRKLDSRHLFQQRDVDELQDILLTAERWRDAGTSMAWVSDDHCVAGGWYERVMSADGAKLAGPCANLRELFNAMQLVHNVVEAEKVADRLAI